MKQNREIQLLEKAIERLDQADPEEIDSEEYQFLLNKLVRLRRERDFPQPGTAEWGRMNQRRASLIKKRLFSESLNEEEQEELDFLQKMSLVKVKKKFPR